MLERPLSHYWTSPLKNKRTMCNKFSTERLNMNGAKGRCPPEICENAWGQWRGRFESMLLESRVCALFSNSEWLFKQLIIGLIWIRQLPHGRFCWKRMPPKARINEVMTRIGRELNHNTYHPFMSKRASSWKDLQDSILCSRTRDDLHTTNKTSRKSLKSGHHS